MPTPTYTALANITLGSSASSVTFSSIPATFRDLVVACNVQASAPNGVKIRVNGLTTGIYSSVITLGDGSSAISYTGGTGVNFLGLNNQGTTMFSPMIVQVMDYSATDKDKTILARQSVANATDGVSTTAGRAATTNAITSIQFLFDTAATFSTGSTFALYGIAS
jgi:hypothetical protein